MNTAQQPSSSRVRWWTRIDPWRDGTTLLCGFLLIYLVGVPLVLLFYGSAATGVPGEAGALSLSRYYEVLSDPDTYRLLGRSVVYALGVAAVALPLGGVTAWLVQRTNLPGKGIFVFLALCPAFMPPVLIALGRILLLDGNIGLVSRFLQSMLGADEPLLQVHSLYGMIWIGGVLDMPLAFLWLWPAFAAMDPALEEAGAMAGGRPWRVLRKVTLPLIWPAIAGAFLISFVLAIEDVTVPILVGLPGQVHVFATDIYLAHAQETPDTARASAQGVILLLVTIGFVWLYRHLTRKSERYAIVRGRGYRPSEVSLGVWRLPVFALMCAVFGFVVLLPLVILLWTSLSPYLQAPTLDGLTNLSLYWYRSLIDDPMAIRGLVNSALSGFGAAVVVMGLSVIVGWAVIRSKNRIWGFLDVLAFLPVAIPGLVVGLGLIWLYVPVALPIYGTLVIIWLAYITKFIPYGARLIYAGLRQLHPELEEAAHVSGASWGKTLRRIILPLLAPTLAAGILYSTMRAFRELPASLLLVSYGNETYSVIAYEMWSAGDPGRTAAYGMVVIVVMTTIVAITWRTVRKWAFR